MIKLAIIEKSIDELVECELLLKQNADLKIISQSSLDSSSDFSLIDRAADVTLISDCKALTKTIALVQKLVALGQKKILIIGNRNVDQEILKLVESGANGYLEKQMIRHYLVKAVQCIDSGEAWISRKITALLLNRLRDKVKSL